MSAASPGSVVVGVVILEADHGVETLDLAHPFAWRPPAGLSPGFFGHPDFWPVPALFAVARGATGTTSALGTPEAVRGVVDAVARLDGRCDLIVGGCGYFGDAWPHLTPPLTFTVLSALDALEDTLRATAQDVVVLSASTGAGLRAVADHPQRARIRVLGMDGAGEWAHFARTDWATAGLVSDAGIEKALRGRLEEESRPGGLLDGVGAVVVECTVLPHHRATIREFTAAPIIDVATMVASML